MDEKNRQHPQSESERGSCQCPYCDESVCPDPSDSPIRCKVRVSICPRCGITLSATATTCVKCGATVRR